MTSRNEGSTPQSFWRYRAFLRQALREELVYKERVFLMLFSVALRMATQLFFWSVVYRQTSRIAGFDRDAIVTYVFMTTALTFLFSGLFHRKMVQSIMDGSISIDLARPVDLYVSYLFAYVGQVIFNLLSYVPVIMVGGIVLFHVRGPRTAAAWLLFLSSLALGVLLWHSVRWLFSLIVVWTETGRGLGLLAGYIVQFLSGGLLPLTFFPAAVAGLFYWLPFQSIMFTPIGIFTGAIGIARGEQLIGVELFWVVALFGLSRLGWSHALRVLSVQGG